jgi:arginase
VDAPDPGGIAYTELELLIAGLVGTPQCLGVEITVFDPDYDPTGTYAAEIVETLVAGLAPAMAVEPPGWSADESPVPVPVPSSSLSPEAVGAGGRVAVGADRLTAGRDGPSGTSLADLTRSAGAGPDVTSDAVPPAAAAGLAESPGAAAGLVESSAGRDGAVGDADSDRSSESTGSRRRSAGGGAAALLGSMPAESPSSPRDAATPGGAGRETVGSAPGGARVSGADPPADRPRPSSRPRSSAERFGLSDMADRDRLTRRGASGSLRRRDNSDDTDRAESPRGDSARPGSSPREGGLRRDTGPPRDGGLAGDGGGLARDGGGLARNGGPPREGGLRRDSGTPREGGLARDGGSRRRESGDARPGAGDDGSAPSDDDGVPFAGLAEQVRAAGNGQVPAARTPTEPPAVPATPPTAETA